MGATARTQQNQTAVEQAQARPLARLQTGWPDTLLASWLIELLEKLKELLVPERQPVPVPVPVRLRPRPRPGVRGGRPSR